MGVIARVNNVPKQLLFSLIYKPFGFFDKGVFALMNSFSAKHPYLAITMDTSSSSDVTARNSEVNTVMIYCTN